MRLSNLLISDSGFPVFEPRGVQAPVIGVDKRWTLSVNRELVVCSVSPNTDPAIDAGWTAETIDERQHVLKPASEVAAT